MWHNPLRAEALVIEDFACDPPAPYVTDTKFGVSGANRLMTSHRPRSISSVFGGKNSKEIAGRFCPRGSAGAAVSLVTLLNSRFRWLCAGQISLPVRAGMRLHSAFWAGLRHRFAFPGKISENEPARQPISCKINVGNCPILLIKLIDEGRE